jgi:hypothetical protein
LAIVVNTPLTATHVPDDTGHPALLDSSILNGVPAALEALSAVGEVTVSAVAGIRKQGLAA